MFRTRNTGGKSPHEAEKIPRLSISLVRLSGQGLDQFQHVVVALRSFRPDLFRYHRLCITDYIV